MIRLLAAAVLGFCVVNAMEKTPIVLVHGIFGWGRGEMPFHYFGGFHGGDYQAELEKQGHIVFTAGVGPVSSNWDRACELYAQIKGGRVDYGQRHSETHGHKRYGRTYEGFYKQWGTVDDDGNVRQIHLVGHSMGGQTSRILSQLLATGGKGSPVEEPEPTSELFTGGKAHWIASITGLATPHHGTFMASLFETTLYGKATQVFLNRISSLLGLLSNKIYDTKMDQWDGNKYSNESILAYIKRLDERGIFRGNDSALYDCTDFGSDFMNSWVKEQPNVFYYSYITADTSPKTIWYHDEYHRVQVPRIWVMNPVFLPFSYYIGGPNAVIHFRKGLSWQENDGAVSTESMKSPSTFTPFQSEHVSGVWHLFPKVQGVDHMGICGIAWFRRPHIVKLYLNHANLLATLPKRRIGHRQLTQQVHQVSSDVLESLTNEIQAIENETEKYESRSSISDRCDELSREGDAAEYKLCRIVLEQSASFNYNS